MVNASQQHPKKTDEPPLSKMIIDGIREKGTGNCRAPARPLVAYRYSIRVNRPSGGTKDKILSRDHFCNLVEGSRYQLIALDQMKYKQVPNTRMKGTIMQIPHIGERQG